MISSLLIQRLEVYRRATAPGGGPDVDRFGQQRAVNPRQHVAGGQTLQATYPCRLTRGRGGLTMTERSVDVFEVRYVIYAPPDTDVEEDDAVRVLDTGGQELLGLSKISQKNLVYDGRGPHHLELSIWAQRGAE